MLTNQANKWEIYMRWYYVDGAWNEHDSFTSLIMVLQYYQLWTEISIVGLFVKWHVFMLFLMHLKGYLAKKQTDII